jgi:hypothetical protein
MSRMVQRPQHRVGDRQVDAREHHQPGEREEEVERQRDDAGQVVQVECAAPGVLVRPEGEELAEDAPVHHDAADECGEHHERRQPDDPGAEVLPVQVQAVVHRVVELAADLELVGRDQRAAARVDRRVAVHVVVPVRVARIRHREAGAHQQHRVAVRRVGPELLGLQALARRHRELRRVGEPRHLVGVVLRVGLQCREDGLQRLVERGHRLGLEARLRQRPAVDLAVEHRECAEEKTGHQHVT